MAGDSLYIQNAATRIPFNEIDNILITDDSFRQTPGWGSPGPASTRRHRSGSTPSPSPAAVRSIPRMVLPCSPPPVTSTRTYALASFRASRSAVPSQSPEPESRGRADAM
jgi:hypothetical protein